MTETIFKPQSGDLIFLRSNHWNATLSTAGQRVKDRYSRVAGRFTHVCMVVGDLIAIEAMPTAGADDAAWSGVTLQEGVRFIPCGDVFHLASLYHILRWPEPADLTFDFNQPEFAELLGSAYSLNHFYLPISSNSTDVSTFMVGQEQREAASAIVPGFAFRHEGAPYFCSQLIVELLKRKSMLPTDTHLSFTLPIGLYKELRRQGWQDVTVSHYSKAAETEFLRRSREISIAKYDELLIMSDLIKRVMSHEEAIRFGNAVTGRVRGDMQQLLEMADETLAKMAALAESLKGDQKSR